MRLLLLLATAATALAQPDTGITITASRNVTAVPDQLLYSVTLRTEASLEVSEVVARLTGTGITAENLSYVSGAGELIDWTFNLVTLFSKMSEMNATLARLQQQIGKVFLSPLLSFRVTSQQTSPDATAQVCPLAALVSDARKEADRIASAAGVHVGAIIGLSEGAGGAIPTFAFAARLGSFSQIIPAVYDPGVGIPTGLTGFLLPYAPPLPIYSPACSIVVQFALVP
jgi:hypothetical protein